MRRSPKTHVEHLGTNSLASVAQSLALNEEAKEGLNVRGREVVRDELESSSDSDARSPGILDRERRLDDHAELIVGWLKLLDLDEEEKSETV